MDEEVTDIHESLVQFAQEHAHQGVVLVHVLAHFHQNAVGDVIDAQADQFVVQIAHQTLQLAFGKVIIQFHHHGLVQPGIQAHHEDVFALADRKDLQLVQKAVGYLGFDHETQLVGLLGQHLHDVMQSQRSVLIMLDQQFAQKFHVLVGNVGVFRLDRFQIGPVTVQRGHPPRRCVRLMDQIELFQLHQIQAQSGRTHALEVCFIQDA